MRKVSHVVVLPLSILLLVAALLGAHSQPETPPQHQYAVTIQPVDVAPAVAVPGLTFTPLPDPDYAAAKEVLLSVLDAYPPRLIADAIDGITLVSELRRSGEVTMWTYAARSVFIVVPKPVDPKMLRVLMHTAICTGLREHNQRMLSVEAWVSALPGGKSYNTKGIDGMRMHAETVKEGFACPSAAVSFDLDVAFTMAYLMSGDPNVWVAADASLNFDRKLAVAIDFLHRLDPQIDRDYLKRLVK